MGEGRDFLHTGFCEATCGPPWPGTSSRQAGSTTVKQLFRACAWPGIVPREPEKLPAQGNGLLTILHPATEQGTKLASTRVELPLIRGDGKRIINPTSEELDASLWGN